MGRPMNALYLLGSLLGIGFLVGLNLLLMGRARPRLDPAVAVALLEAEHPGFCARNAVVAVTSDAALIEDAAGALYLVMALGDKLASRRLAKDQVVSVVRDGRTLTLRLRDFTFRRARLALSDDAEAGEWERRLLRVSV